MKESSEQPVSHSIDDVEEMLCPHCLRPVDPISHFCNACGGPTSGHSAIDPMGQVYTAGHAYRAATDRPTKFIIVLGIWLIFAPGVLPLIYVCLGITSALVLPNNSQGGTGINVPNLTYGLIGILITLGMSIIYCMIIFKTTRAYIRTRRQAQAACNGCDEPIGDNFRACWNCGTPHEDDQHPDPQSTVDPLAPRPTSEQCEYMPQSLTGQACPECGASVNERAQDPPHDSLPAEHRREDRVRRAYLFTWLASWVSVPIVSSVLKPLIPYGETGGILIHTILFVVLIIAVISPLAFFYNLLPDNPSSS